MREPKWSSLFWAAVIGALVTSGGHGYGVTAYWFCLILFYKLDGLKEKES